MNINSLLQKIDELRAIAKLSNATVIEISKSKIDNSINDSEIFIKGCSVIRRDQNRKGEGLVCYVSNTFVTTIKAACMLLSYHVRVSE